MSSFFVHKLVSNDTRYVDKTEVVSMSKQDLFNKYKQEICNCCLNKSSDDCNICICTDSTVKCCNYVKDKSKLKNRYNLPNGRH